jgi:HPr kinase/phosphorylase
VTPPAPPRILHATCVAVEGRGLLITGPSGAGKSSLALRLMALGAILVADDRTEVTPGAGGLIARAPAAIRGRIEARGLGILNAETLDSVALRLVADLGTPETERLPPRRWTSIEGCRLEVIHGQRGGHFSAAILHYMRAGRSD